MVYLTSAVVVAAALLGSAEAQTSTRSVPAWGFPATNPTGVSASITSYQDFGVGHDNHGLYVIAADPTGSTYFDADITWSGATTALQVATLRGPLTDVELATSGGACTLDAECGTAGTCTSNVCVCADATGATSGTNGITGEWGPNCVFSYFTPDPAMYSTLCGTSNSSAPEWTCGSGKYDLHLQMLTDAETNIKAMGNVIALHNIDASCTTCDYPTVQPVPFNATVNVNTLVMGPGANLKTSVSFIDPGLDHETHQLMPTILPASFDSFPLTTVSGNLAWECSEPVQLAQLNSGGNPTAALDNAANCSQNYYGANCTEMYWTPVMDFALAPNLTNIARFPLAISFEDAVGRSAYSGEIVALHTFTNGTHAIANSVLDHPFFCWYADLNAASETFAPTAAPVAPTAPTAAPTPSDASASFLSASALLVAMFAAFF